MRKTKVRRGLILTTALNGVLLLANAPAQGQSGVTLSNITATSGTAAPQISTDGTRIDIGINSAAGAQVVWDRFDIPRDNTIAFTDATAAPGTAPLAVLNRVTGNVGVPSIINGALTSDANIAVYLVNPSGITFGPTGAVNVGALIASAIDVAGTFDAAGRSNRFDPTGGSNQFRIGARAGTITVAPRPARPNGLPVETLLTRGVKVAGGTALGDLVLIGASVQMPGPIGTDEAARLKASGDVAMVAAHDVTVATSQGSPLSITIAKGTTISNIVTIDGAVEGRNVTLALARQDGVVNALLSVNGSMTATGAAASDRGIVLSAGAPSGEASDPAVSYAAGVPAADLRRDTSLSSAAALRSARSVRATAGGSATVEGSVLAANGDYVVRAGGVGLGAANAAVTQQATGMIDVAATGAITGFGTLRLEANRADAAYTPLVNRAIFLEGSSVALGGATLTTGTVPADAYAVQVRSAGAVALGQVTAFGITALDANRTLVQDSALNVAGDLTIGAATLQAARFDVAGDLTIDSLATRGDAVLTTSAGGNVTIGVRPLGAGTVTAGAGAVRIDAAGDAAIAAAVEAAGDYAVAGDTVTLGGASAVTQLSKAGALTVTARDGTIATGTAALTLQTVAAQPLTVTTAAASSAGAITLGDATLLSGGAVDVTAAPTATAVTLGDVTAGAALTIDSAGGTLTAGALSGTSATLSATDLIKATSVAGTAGTIRITGTGGVEVTGAIGATGLLTIDRPGTLTAGSLSGNGIAIGQNVRGGAVTVAGTVRSAAGGDVKIASNGAQTYNGAIEAGGAVTLDTNAALRMETLTAGGRVELRGDGVRAVAVEQSAGGILTIAGRGTGAVSLGVLSANDGIEVSGPNAVSVTGSVTAGTDYIVTGAGVTLGGTAGAVQTARRAVTIAARSGDVRALGGMVLRADDRGTGAGVLTLETRGTGARTIDTRAATLAGGTARQSEVRILSADTAGLVELGSVNALALQGDGAGGTYADTITRAGPIGLGTLSLERGLVARSTAAGLTTGGVRIERVGAALTLDAATTIVGAGADVSANGATIVRAGGAITLNGLASRGATLEVSTGNAALTAATASARDALTITTGSSGTTAIDTLSGGGVTVTSAALSGRAGGRAAVTATRNGVASLTLGTGRLGAVTAGTVSATATTLDVASATATDTSGATPTAGSVSIEATELIAGALDAASFVTLTADVVRLDTARAGGGDVTIDADLLTGRAAGTPAVPTRSALEASRDVALTLGEGLLGTVAGAGVRVTATTLDVSAATARTGDLRVTGFAELTAGTLDAARDLTVDGGRVALDAGSAGRDLTIGAAALTGRPLPTLPTPTRTRSALDAGGNVTLTLGEGLLGTVAGTAVRATATTLDVSGATARTGELRITGLAELTAGALDAARDLTVDGGRVALDLGSAGGALTIGADTLTGRPVGTPAVSTRSALDAGGDVALMLGAGLLGTVAGAGVRVTAATLDVSGATARTGELRITGFADLTAGTLDAGRDLIVDGGRVALDRGSAGGALTIGAAALTGRPLPTLPTPTRTRSALDAGGDVTLTLGEGLLGTVAGAGVRMTATTLDVAAARAASGAVALTTTGAATLGSATARGAGGAVTVQAGGAARVTGAVDTGGTYGVTGTGVTLGDGATRVVQQADAAVSIRAVDGDLTGGSGLTLRANADARGGDALTLSTAGGSAGAIALAGAVQAGPTRAAGSALVVRSRAAGNGVALGDVVAAELLGAVGAAAAPATGIVRDAAVSLGAVDLGGALLLDSGADVRTGAVSATAVTLRAGAGTQAAALTARTGAVTLAGAGGARVTGAVDAAGDLTVEQGGALTLSGTVAARNVAIGAAGVRPTTVTVGGALTARGTLTVRSTGAQSYDGDVAAGGATTLAGSALTLRDLTGAADVALTAAGGAIDGGIVRAGGAATLDAGAGLALTRLAATGAAEARGAGVTLDSAASRDAALTLTARGGAVSARELIAGSDVVLAATGALAVDQATAGRDLLVGDAAGVSGRADARAALAAARDLRLTVRGGLRAAVLDAGRDLGVAAGTIDVTRGGAGGAIMLEAGGDLAAGTLSATGAVVARGGSVALGSVTGGTLTLAGQAGGLSLVEATGSGDVAIAARDTATVGTVVVGGALTLDAGDATLASARAATLAATARRGGLTIDAATTSGDVAIAARDRAAAGVLTAGGALTLTGGTIALGSATAGRDIALAAGGDLGATTVTSSTGALTATAGGAAALTTVSAAGAVAVSGASVGLGTVRAGALNAAASARGLTVDDAEVAGALALRGAADVTGRRLVSSGGALDVSAGGAAGLTTMTSAQAATVSGASVGLGTVRAGAIDATASVGGLTVDDAATGGAMTLTAQGVVRGRLLESGGATVIAGRGATLTTVRGAALRVTAGAAPLAIDAAQVAGDVAVRGAGAVEVRQATSSAGAMTLDAGGALRATTLAAARGLTVGGAEMTIGAASGADVALSARAGTLAVGGVTAQGGATLAQRGAAGALTVAQALSASGDATLDAEGGVTAPALTAGGALRIAGGAAATLGTITAGGALDVRAADAVTIAGAVAAQEYRVEGAQVALGDGAAAVVQQARGAVEIVATRGAVTGAGGLVLRADRDGTGAGDLTLRAGGAVTFDPGSQLLAGDEGSGTLRVTPGPGAALALATVRARRLVSAEPGATRFAHDGAVTIADLGLREATELALTGAATPLTLDRVAGGGALTLAASGAVTIGQAQVAGALDLRGGTVAAGSVTADGAALTADGALTVATLTTQRDATLRAGGALRVTDATIGGAGEVAGTDSVAIGRIAVTDALTMTAGGEATVDAVSAGEASMSAGGALAVATLTTQRDATLRAGGALRVTDATIGGAGEVAGKGNVAIGRMAATGALTVAADGDAALDAVSAGEASMSADGALAVATLTTQRDATLRAGGALRVTDATIGGAGEVAGKGNVAIGQMAATGALTIAADGDAALDAVSAGEASMSAGGALTIATLTTQRDATLRAGGSLSLADATIGGVGDVAGKGDVVIGRIATAGALTITAWGDATLDAVSVGAARLGTGDALTAVGLATMLDARGAAAGGGAGRGAARVTGAQAVTPGAVAAITALAVDAGAGATLDRGAGASVAIDAGRALTIGTLDVAGDAALTAGTDLGVTTATVGGAATLRAGQGASLGVATTTGALTLDAGGGATLGTIEAGALTVRAGGATTVGTATARGDALAVAGGALDVGTWTGAAGSELRGQAVAVDTLRTDGALAVSTVGGAVRLGSTRVGGAATIASGADVDATALTTAGDATLTAAGALRAGALASTGGAARLTGDTIVVDTLATAGAATLAARSVSVGASTTGAMLDATARAGDLTLGTVHAGATTLRASGSAAVTGAVTVAGAHDVRAGSIVLGGDGAVAQRAGGIALTAGRGSVASRGALALEAGAGGLAIAAEGSGGAVDLTPATALTSGGALSIATTGVARLGSVANPGRTVAIRAGDLALAAAVVAGEVAIVGHDAARGIRLGDAPAAHGAEYDAAAARLDLGGAELGLIDAARVSIDAGQGPVTLGDMALKPATGATQVAVRTRGRIDALGRFVAEGSLATRTIVLGGGSDEATRATQLRVAATAAAGGRLLVGDATLELRADAIGVGLDEGFLGELGLTTGAPIAASAAASTYVAQSSSSLYNAGRIGVAGLYADRTTVRAGRLIVRYGGFALFQNTGLSGVTDGVAIGAPTQGQSAGGGTVQLQAAAPANTVALFGTIDGIGGTATSLLGTDTLVVGDGVARADSRANGCLIGAAGGGCLSASLAQPVLNVFDSSRIDVFRAGDDLTLPFDPLISTSNEALFSDIADTAVAPEGRLDEGPTSPEEACRTERAACTPAGRP